MAKMVARLTILLCYGRLIGQFVAVFVLLKSG
jgi:hypothetical protein